MTMLSYVKVQQCIHYYDDASIYMRQKSKHGTSNIISDYRLLFGFCTSVSTVFPMH